MSSHLLIVESPSKAKTLKKYLGKEFTILASYGHVRDLIPKTGAVDPKNDFSMRYELITRNIKHLNTIISAAGSADTILLATDPDREGEAIAWHLLEILKEQNLIADKTVRRVVFHEITKTAVQEAVAHPRELALELVNAQQARRALDYLVGFNLSPLLWKKIRRGLSAGRVQSPALRLICERENEIRAFSNQEYWSVHIDTHKGKQKFSAKLTHINSEKLEQFSINNEAEFAQLQQQLSAGSELQIDKIEKRAKQRNPVAPFTTSTMQQEAVRKLGLTTDRTMRTAQQLYEGINISEGTVGLITYMRTDSVALAQEALNEIRGYIQDNYTPDYLPEQPIVYKNKSKNAQEAHEAVRPTSILRTPDSLKEYLSPEQYKLYEMIWKRTLACQMTPAKYNTVSIDLSIVGETQNTFRASGQTLMFAGFISVYLEDVDDSEEEDQTRLPVLKLGELLSLDKLYGEQHFTQPPPRYGEASIVKTLEEYGIGRPSTYASIISTLKARDYVSLDKKRFTPTDVGDVVNKFLTAHFSRYVDYHFTANLEDELDQIAAGEREWIPVLRQFWDGFEAQIIEKTAIPRQDLTQETLDEACPKCSKPLNIRLGRRGKFIGCTDYPSCDYTRDMGDDAEADSTPEVLEGRNCPLCSSELLIKKGQYGRFIGCSAYPKCKHIEPLEKPKDTGVVCPECNKGALIERKSRYGKLFYSCNTYPTCKYATWNPPIKEPCPQCGWPILTIKTTKRRGTEKVCPQKECGYTHPAPELAPAPEADI